MTALPTISEAQTALALMNKGREAIGLEPLDKFDFDGAEPNMPTNCLSARTVFADAGYAVLTTYVSPLNKHGEPDPRPEALKAMGMVEQQGGRARWVIPDAILKVTNPFDDSRHSRAAEQRLRDRLVEAGVV